MIDPKELDELLAICRKHNVTVFTDGRVRVAFAANGQQVTAPQNATMQPVKPGYRPMTDFERFAFAATEGYPDDDDAFVPVTTDPVPNATKQ